jgi:anti-anti-sigma factor
MGHGKELQVQIERGSAAVEVHVQGELDLFTLADLAQALSEAACVTARDIVVDLSGVEFLDVLTLNLMCQTASELQWQGGRLRVRGLNAHQRRTWQLCELDELITADEPSAAGPQCRAHEVRY